MRLSSSERLAALREGSLPLARYLDELEAHFNRREPAVLAFLPEPDRFGRLRREAAALEKRFPVSANRPPLFGMPLGIKDIFHVDGFVTRAGSRLPPALLQGPEASSVTRLRQAGALVLGKTVTTEFAYFAPGPTRNPHHPDHTPGGSSSGSAAAVGADLCALALGTQTIGSIIRPASYCGVLGFKPTYEFIFRDGVIPLSPSLDHVGLFAADVTTLTRAAHLLVRPWPEEALPATPVLGVPTGPYLDRAEPAGLAHFERACARLAADGLQLRHVPAMDDFNAIERRHQRLMAAEAAQVHATWYRTHRTLYHDRTAALIEDGLDVPAADILEGRESRVRLRHDLRRLMLAHGIDLWLAPAATGSAPRGLDSTGDPVMNLPWTHAGLPVVAVPSGMTTDGLPIGCQMVAGWGQDARLLNWAGRLAQLLAPESLA